MVLADLGNAQCQRGAPRGRFPGPGAVSVTLAVRGALTGAGVELLTRLGEEPLDQCLLRLDRQPVIALKEFRRVGTVDGTLDSHSLPCPSHIDVLSNPIIFGHRGRLFFMRPISGCLRPLFRARATDFEYPIGS